MVREHINAEDSYVPPWHFNQAVKVTDGASKIFRMLLLSTRPMGRWQSLMLYPKPRQRLKIWRRWPVPRAAFWPMLSRPPSTQGRTFASTVTRSGRVGLVVLPFIHAYPGGRLCQSRLPFPD